MGGPLTPGQQAAQQRIAELLAELVEIIGPASDGQAVYDPGDAPAGTPVLWEYVIACCWVDDNATDYVTVVPAAGMLNHHTVGLLRAALAYAEDYQPTGGTDQ